MIQYYRFCCKIRIADERAPEMPGAELLAAEDRNIDDVRVRFADARDSPFSDWYSESPALRAHILALKIGHHSAETGNPGERFITTASALVYTGRDRQVLYRWEKEGRITRYGSSPPGRALWDVFELPAAPRSGDPRDRSVPPKKS